VLVAVLLASACGGSSRPALRSTSSTTGNTEQATTVIADCGTGAYQPARIIATCPEGRVIATDIHWAQWTPTEGDGSSVVQVNPCRPSCAAISAQPYDARIVLSNPVVTRQGAHFSKLTIEWRGTRPPVDVKDGYSLPT
jgi:hypothetical protein